MEMKKYTKFGITLASVALLGAAYNVVHADDAAATPVVSATTQPSTTNVDPNIFKEDNGRGYAEKKELIAIVETKDDGIYLPPSVKTQFDPEYLKEHEKEEAAKAEQAARRQEILDAIKKHSQGETPVETPTSQPSNDVTENNNNSVPEAMVGEKPTQPDSSTDTTVAEKPKSEENNSNPTAEDNSSKPAEDKPIVPSDTTNDGATENKDKPSNTTDEDKVLEESNKNFNYGIDIDSIGHNPNPVDKVITPRITDKIINDGVVDESLYTSKAKLPRPFEIEFKLLDRSLDHTELLTDGSGEIIKGETLSIKLPKYIESNGKYYAYTNKGDVILYDIDNRFNKRLVSFNFEGDAFNFDYKDAIRAVFFNYRNINENELADAVNYLKETTSSVEQPSDNVKPVETPTITKPESSQPTDKPEETPTSQPSNGENQTVNYTVQLVDQDSKVIRSSVESGVEGTRTRILVTQLNGYLFNGYETPTGSDFTGKDTEISFPIQKDAVIKLHYKFIPPINEIISPEKRAEYQTVYDEFHKTILEAYDVYKKELGVDDITYDQHDRFTKDLSAIHGELVLNRDALDTPVGTALSDDYFIKGLGWTTEYWNYRIENLKTDTQTLKTALNNIAASKPAAGEAEAPRPADDAQPAGENNIPKPTDGYDYKKDKWYNYIKPMFDTVQSLHKKLLSLNPKDYTEESWNKKYEVFIVKDNASSLYEDTSPIFKLNLEDYANFVHSHQPNDSNSLGWAEDYLISYKGVLPLILDGLVKVTPTTPESPTPKPGDTTIPSPVPKAGVLTNRDKSVSVKVTGDDVTKVTAIKTEKVTDVTVLAKLPASISPENVSMYDIKVLDENGKVINITSEATITLPIDSSRKVSKVIYYLPQTGAIEELPFTLNGNSSVSFKVTHFSNYGIVYEPEKEVEQPVSPKPNEETPKPSTPEKPKPKADMVDNKGQNDKKGPESVIDNKTTTPQTKPVEKRKTQESHKQDSTSNQADRKEDLVSQSADKTEKSHPTAVMTRLSNGQIVETKSPSHAMTSTTSLPNTGVAKTNVSLIGFILSLLGLSGLFYKGRHVYRK